MSRIFEGCSNLRKVVFGTDWSFKGKNIRDVSMQALLPVPSGEQYTGKWVREDGSYGPYTPEELRDNYTPAMAGTWVWEIGDPFTIAFEGPEGSEGAMSNVQMYTHRDNAIPKNEFAWFNHHFDHWDGDDGNTYTDEQVIPANTMEAGSRLVLTAVFEKDDNHLNFSEGEAEVILHGGEKIILPSLPGGTKYQVYEETPSGWHLINQENPSGSIPASDTVDSVFMNEYVPGTATISLIAQKTLDGRIPADGQFSFELLQGNKVIETVNNNSAGIVSFTPLVFREPGTFTYEIREIRGEDESINYDSHTETIVIMVEDDGHGNLTATSSQGDTIPTFENETKQGSLSFSKLAEGEGTFTFEITLTDDFGRPLDGVSIVE